MRPQEPPPNRSPRAYGQAQAAPEAAIAAFVADWFARFDRLAPADAFMPDLAPDVVWQMDGVDTTLHGHARFDAWYAGILTWLAAPTVHTVGPLHITKDPTRDGASFDVRFHVRVTGNTLAGDPVDLRAVEAWRVRQRPSGRPLITHRAEALGQPAEVSL